MKALTPNSAHRAFHEALKRAVGAEGASLDATELLAVTAQFVGQLIALQDQRTVTPEMAMALVSSNIEQGNREVIQSLLRETGGNA